MTETGKRGRVEWRGYMPAMVTPFDADLALDHAALARHLEWLHAEGMHGLIFAGTTGEWTSLAPAERKALFDTVGTEMAGKLPIIAGCTAFTADEAVDFALHAHGAHFDGILVTPPPYIRPNDAEILGYYRSISDRSPLPICVYNWPPGTGIDMSLDLLERLSDLDQVVAIKQSTSDLSRFVKTFFALREKVRVFGFTMDEHGLALLEARGGDGTMGAGGVLGRDHPDFYNCLWRGDIEGARACGKKDRKILEEWYTPQLVGRFGSGPAVLKAAFAAIGQLVGGVRPPLMDISTDNRAAIARTLAALGKS